jgi:hypothetical protein
VYALVVAATRRIEMLEAAAAAELAGEAAAA